MAIDAACGSDAPLGCGIITAMTGDVGTSGCRQNIRLGKARAPRVRTAADNRLHLNIAVTMREISA
jgi:hypothetical protein